MSALINLLSIVLVHVLHFQYYDLFLSVHFKDLVLIELFVLLLAFITPISMSSFLFGEGWMVGKHLVGMFFEVFFPFIF